MSLSLELAYSNHEEYYNTLVYKGLLRVRTSLCIGYDKTCFAIVIIMTHSLDTIDCVELLHIKSIFSLQRELQ